VCSAVFVRLFSVVPFPINGACWRVSPVLQCGQSRLFGTVGMLLMQEMHHSSWVRDIVTCGCKAALLWKGSPTPC
jgi:hypothetical protein